MLPGLVLACASPSMREVRLGRILLSVGKVGEGWITTLIRSARIVCMLVGQRLLGSASAAVGKEGRNRMQEFGDEYLKF